MPTSSPVFRVWCAAALAAGVLTVGASPAAQTPTLGDVARKEAARRKAQDRADKVYTNKDLPESAQRPAAAPASTTIPLPDSAPAQAEQKPDARPDGETKDEAWWKTRMVQAREELRRNEMFAEALQSRINALSRDFVNRDNPVQRARISEERGEALNELARVKQEIERGKKQIEDIEEEARKAGVPPGWLR